MDGCPDKPRQRRAQLFWALVYSLYIIGKPPENHGGLVKAAGRLLLCLVPFKNMRYRLWKLAQRKMSKYPISECRYVTELCSGPRYMKLRYPAQWFASALYEQFEGYMLPLPIGCEQYLNMAFGDYMTPPPKEQQICHHEFEIIDMDNCYKIYKGKYYCTKESKNAD